MAQKTNEEFVSELMSQSTYGQLMQVFVVEAVRYYSNQVAATPEPDSDDNAFISPKVWHMIAKDVKQQLEKAFEQIQRDH